jgi:hypothetical protein
VRGRRPTGPRHRRRQPVRTTSHAAQQPAGPSRRSHGPARACRLLDVFAYTMTCIAMAYCGSALTTWAQACCMHAATACLPTARPSACQGPAPALHGAGCSAGSLPHLLQGAPAASRPRRLVLRCRRVVMAATGQICTATLTRLLLRRPLTRGQVVGVSSCGVPAVPPACHAMPLATSRPAISPDGSARGACSRGPAAGAQAAEPSTRSDASLAPGAGGRGVPGPAAARRRAHAGGP